MRNKDERQIIQNFPTDFGILGTLCLVSLIIGFVRGLIRGKE